jgi:hypothetical protein
LLASLGLGFGWSLAGPFGFWLFSGLSWHIYAGAALVPVLTWHTIHFTRRLPLSYWADRRSFLRLPRLRRRWARPHPLRRSRGTGDRSGQPSKALHRLLPAFSTIRRPVPGGVVAQRPGS